MKSHARTTYQQILECLLKDGASMTAVEYDKRDLKYILSRSEHEGMSFLTISLPSFGADFEKSLSAGRIDSKSFRSFKKLRAIPCFLKGMTSLVFNLQTGYILEEPNHAAIYFIRQIAYSFKKIEIECNDSRKADALRRYLQDEADLVEALDTNDSVSFESVSNAIWRPLFVDINPFEAIPKHGPGATVEHLDGNAKYNNFTWHDRLERSFPVLDNLFTTVDAREGTHFHLLNVHSVEREDPVRVCFVPKTLKTPRVIAIEPTCMQYAQQGISQIIVSKLESSMLTKGHINFSDQSINQRLAMDSSCNCNMSTIDLSSASDRVPYHLAMRMFQYNETLYNAIDDCRSRSAQLPDGNKVTELKKFASMGSALCFPIEAMYFFTLCVKALLEIRKLPVTSRNIFKVSRDVYVYGDDIIVPAHETADVIVQLQKYYCKVNAGKSFWTGKFRESCGADYYDGTDVKPVYIRKTVPHDIRDVSFLLSWLSTCNQFYLKGCWRTSDFLKNILEKILGPLPVVSQESEGLGLVSYTNYLTPGKVRGRYQRPEIRTWVSKPVYKEDRLEGYGALTKCLLSIGLELIDKKHLERSVRRGVVKLRRRWVAC